MIRVVNAQGSVVTEILIPTSIDIDATYGRTLLDVIRGAVGSVYIRHPSIDAEWFSMNRTNIMDLNREFQRTKTDRVDSQLRKILVAPAGLTLPDDGILSYVEIANVFDLRDIADNVVVLFRPDSYPVLKLLCENSQLLGFEVAALVGLPATEYTADFESVVWALDKVAYAPFISELRLSIDMQSRIQAESASVYDTERKQITRSNGTVKPHLADVASTSDSSLDD